MEMCRNLQLTHPSLRYQRYLLILQSYYALLLISIEKTPSDLTESAKKREIDVDFSCPLHSDEHKSEDITRQASADSHRSWSAALRCATSSACWAATCFKFHTLAHQAVTWLSARQRRRQWMKFLLVSLNQTHNSNATTSSSLGRSANAAKYTRGLVWWLQTIIWKIRAVVHASDVREREMWAG